MDEKITCETFINIARNKSCIICYNYIIPEDICITNCDHIYCNSCLNSWFNKGKISCPMCRQEIISYTNNQKKNRVVKVLNHEAYQNREGDNGPQNNGQQNNREETVPRNSNFIVLSRMKINSIKLITLINISYNIYLQYMNIRLSNTLDTISENCTYF